MTPTVRVPPPVPPDRICECSLRRQSRGLEPLTEAQLSARRLARMAKSARRKARPVRALIRGEAQEVA